MKARTSDQDAAISFRQLELFVAVGRSGSIRGAARACGLSQPAATQTLALLQERVGVPLLERSGIRTALTICGHRFHAHCSRIVGAAGTAIADLPAPGGAVRRLSPAQVRTAIAVFESGTLERAALATGLTRSAMRRSAHVLESHLGTLFEHTPDGARFTPAAERFARRLAMLGQEVSSAVREAVAIEADAANTVTVGAAQAFGNRLLARVLAALGETRPAARITVLREGPVELIGRLRKGEVDLVVGDVDETGPDLLKERLVATPYFVFARPGHPLSRPNPLAVDDLARFDWVGGTPGSVRETVRAALFADVPLPRMAFAASEGAMVGHFVAGSNRLALMTEHESRCGGLALARLPFPPIECGLGIDVVHRRDRRPSLLHCELVDLLRAHLVPVPARPDRERHAA